MLVSRNWMMGVLGIGASASLSLSAGCSASDAHGTRGLERGDPAAVEPSDELYDSGRLHQVEIEMAPASWDTLREQGFSLFQFERGEAGDFDYTYFDATVTVDGHTVDHVAVRKKGGLGSLSRLRPSLILDPNRFVGGQEVSGVDRLTLNNDRSDPTA